MKILALTGGGCFCFGQALLLAGFDLSKFDVIAGTSGGGINALCVASDQHNEMIKFYRDYAKEIFSGYSWRHYKPWCPRYNDTVFRSRLYDIFGFTLLNDFRQRVIIGCHNLATNSPKVYDSRDTHDGAVMAKDVARMTAAAPTYFDPYLGMSDGGVFFNDPIMAAITCLLRDGVTLQEIEVFGVGSGISDDSPDLSGLWNPIKWLQILMSAFLNGGSVKKDREYAKAALPRTNYIHIDFPRLRYDMDDFRVIDQIPTAWAKEIQAGREQLAVFLER